MEKYTIWATKQTNENIAVGGNKINLVRFAKSREVEGLIVNATVRCNLSGRYFVLSLVETEVQELPKINSYIKIDVELKNLQFFRLLEEKLTKAQCTLSRKTNGSFRWNKQRVMVASIHEYMENLREYYLDKISTEIIKNYNVISIEDLQVSNMLKNHKLAKAITEVSWS